MVGMRVPVTLMHCTSIVPYDSLTVRNDRLVQRPLAGRTALIIKILTKGGGRTTSQGGRWTRGTQYHSRAEFDCNDGSQDLGQSYS